MGEKQKGRLKKQNNSNKRLYGRLALVCAEIFALVVIVGIGLLIWQDVKTENAEKESQQAAVVEELLIDSMTEDVEQEDGERENEETVLEETSRYGAELADAGYCEENRIHAKETISEDEVVLTFAGDVSFAEGYANMGALRQREGDIEKCFGESLMLEMQNADIFMINNEFPYTNRGTPLVDKTFTFHADPQNVKYLDDMGVDIVSIANNHVYDYGEVSLWDTLETLEDAGVPYVGAGRNIEEAVKPVYFIVNDIKIAYVAATQIEQGDNPDTVGAGENSAGVFRCWNDDRVCEVVKEAKANADFVVAYIHWGTESTDVLHWSQLDLAPKLVEAGVDLIVGDHPHCLQEIAYIDNVPVIYSMGNFWFNSKTQDTGILKVAITQDGMKSLQFVPAIQSGCKTTLAAEGDCERILNYIQELSPTITIDNAGYIMKR